MNSNSTKVSPRGWALLVLAGGGALAFPFLKPAKSNSDAHASLNSGRADAVGDPVAIAVASATPTQVGLMVGHNAHPTDRNDKKAPQSALIPNQHVADNDESSLHSVLTDGRFCLPKTDGGTAAAGLPTELPAWAKPPSLLDSLMTQKPTELNASVAESAVRPSQFEPWQNSASNDERSSNLNGGSDRLTPFGDQNQIASTVEQTRSDQATWPEDDPRTAVDIPSRPKAVGRDAMIRSATPAPQNAIPQLNTTRSVSHATGEAAQPMSEPTERLPHIEFGGNSEGRRRGQAALSSQVPPAAELFIHQPRRP